MTLWSFKCLAWFGLMHLIATNLCMWIRTITVETMRDVIQRSPGQMAKSTDSVHAVPGNTSALQVLDVVMKS